MRHDIHLAALRAAARVAFATGVLVGCSSSADESAETTSSDLGTNVDESAAADASAASDAGGRDASRPLPCCWMVPDENQTECRWSGPGCTPWGPPVPPAMRARAIA